MLGKKFIKNLAGFSSVTALVFSSFYYSEKIEPIFTGVYRSSNLLRAFIQSLFVYYGDEDISTKHQKAATYLRRALEKNSGIYIKLGQILASIEVLVPKEYTNELSILFERAPVTPFPEVISTLESSLSGEWDRFFTHIDSLPIAAGSIAQVHVARLLNGDEVAIKVQHPGLISSLSYDIALCGILAKLLRFFAEDYNFDWAVQDMKTYLPQELNFEIEVSNCLKLQKLFKHDQKVRTPKIYEDLCSEKLIVMELVKGYSVANVERIRQDGICLKEVAKTISRAFNKMIFQLGFIHGDPHPGNIFIEPLGKEYKIVLLDHGLYRIMSPATRVAYAKLWTGIVTQKEPLIKEACSELNIKDFFKTFTSMVTYQDYEQIAHSSEKSFVKRLNGLRNHEKKFAQNLKKATKNKKVIFKCLETMNKELLLVLKVNSYLDSIEGKLGPRYYNIYFTAKAAFELYLQDLSCSAVTFRQKSRNFLMRLYFHFLLFSLKIYELAKP